MTGTAKPFGAPRISVIDWRLLQALEKSFSALAGPEAVIDAPKLQHALGLRSGYLAGRMLKLLDSDGDGLVRRDEFLAGVRRLVTGSPEEKLRFAFDLHDHDGDGTIEPEEMRRMVAISLAEDDVSVDDTQLERVVRAVFDKADRNRDGRISFGEMSAAVHARPRLLEQMTRSEARWIAPNEDLLARLAEDGALSRSAQSHWLQTRARPWILPALWIIANAVLFVSGMVDVAGRGTARSNVFWMLSSGCTTAIQFNTGLILLPVLRRLLTWLRLTPLARLLPIDDAVDFHRHLGNTLYGLCVGHSIAAIADYATSDDFIAQLSRPRALTGLAWLVVFSFLWSFSRTSVRRSGKFELFYYSHLLYVAWFAVGMFHARAIALVAVVPLLALAIEHVVRRVRRRPQAPVIAGEALRSGVTRLEIQRPAGFSHRPGDWIFLRIPEIARHEWHPFTISSAPERESLTVHVRSLGDWSAALRRRVESHAPNESAPRLIAHVDGPYGSPSTHIFAARFPVLIGAGIGVTPFASVLESLLLRHRAGTHDATLRKGHFYWLNRDQYSFEWFRALLTELEQMDTDAALDINIWMTGGRSGATAMGRELGREILREAGERDLVSGLRTKMHMGHPDWESELRGIQQLHAPEKIDVFFCGPPGLAHTLRATCTKLGVSFREEKF